MRPPFLLIALLFILVFHLDSVAQNDKQAKITLKNGNIIKGGIIGSFDSTRLKVKIDDSNIILIKYDHISSINFSGYGNANGDFNEKPGNPPSVKTESYYHEIKGGVMFAEENLDVSLQTINGYQFNKYLGAGLGLGINKYENYITMPIYLQLKGYLYEKKVSPFYYGDIGYGFAWNTNKYDNNFEIVNVNGGLYWQLGLGYQVNFHSSSMIFTLGYISQNTSAEYIDSRPWMRNNNDVDISEKRILRRIAFSVGFLF